VGVRAPAPSPAAPRPERWAAGAGRPAAGRSRPLAPRSRPFTELEAVAGNDRRVGHVHAGMRIALLNPPHSSIGSRIPDEHLPPLGLLSIGGPLLDSGHEVTLVDADLENLRDAETIGRVVALGPDAVLIGHSGSTSAHPVVRRLTRALRVALPRARIVYGGVFPSYHFREVLEEEPQIDVCVRGEGERTVVELARALERGSALDDIAGIAFRDRAGSIVTTPAAPVVTDLDQYRVGWELIDHRRYTYWGDKRAVVVQFSRGCPHPCNYCGQRGFWTRWRHRDPTKLAKEIARLHREHGVVVFNFADENPTSSRIQWKAFCEALIAEDVKVILVGSTRAGDIVRDRDILPLYKRAGVARFLLGMESTDPETLARIRKGSTTTIDREAIRLLRANGILSMATWVVGFEEETSADHLRGLRQLLSYDPDQVQLLYVTPHRWTPFFELARHRRVIQPNRERWDYKHQVLATRHLAPWQVLAWVKLTELVLQARPRAIWRTLFQPDAGLRDAMRWYTRMGRRVWPFELRNFFLRDRRIDDGPTLEEMWGAPQASAEQSMVVLRRARRSTTPAAPR
jgi:anaerobic magnesium-protoporphyrin IX monomethyl ester cyclase